MAFCKSKKGMLVVASILLVLVVIGGIVFVSSSQWEKDFYISGGKWVANGYKNGAGVEGSSIFDVLEKGNPYYEYTIGNTTNRKMRDVVVVFKCEAGYGPKEKWKYEYSVGTLNPHEEKTIRIYHWNMYDNKPTMGGNHTIARIKYDKT